MNIITSGRKRTILTVFTCLLAISCLSSAQEKKRRVSLDVRQELLARQLSNLEHVIIKKIDWLKLDGQVERSEQFQRAVRLLNTSNLVPRMKNMAKYLKSGDLSLAHEGQERVLHSLGELSTVVKLAEPLSFDSDLERRKFSETIIRSKLSLKESLKRLSQLEDEIKDKPNISKELGKTIRDLQSVGHMLESTHQNVAYSLSPKLKEIISKQVKLRKQTKDELAKLILGK